MSQSGSLILIVDDEPMVLRSATTALAMAGFRVMVAENGAAGLDAFAQAPDEIALVLADIIMPGIGGLEMVERIRAIRPEARILLMSGYSDAVLLTLPGAKFPLIRKPFLPEDLVRMVRSKIQPPAASA